MYKDRQKRLDYYRQYHRKNKQQRKRGRPATVNEIVRCPLCKHHIKQCACPDDVAPPKIRKQNKNTSKSDVWRVEPFYWTLPGLK